MAPDRVAGHVAVHDGTWLGLAGRPASAFKVGVRDAWIGWSRAQQFSRVHLIAHTVDAVQRRRTCTRTPGATGRLRVDLPKEAVVSEDLVYQRPYEMHVFVAGLHLHRADLGQQFALHGQAVSQVAQCEWMPSRQVLRNVFTCSGSWAALRFFTLRLLVDHRTLELKRMP